jgi:pimeloyl-ACP methyl ester carboxylesterase
VRTSLQREKVGFDSGGVRLAAWHYPGGTGACVVMAGGFAVTKEPGTDAFAHRFHQAGFSVLAFDYRNFGESGGQPRQVGRLRDQVADWHAAIGHARTLPEVDPDRVALWAFSASGGHVFRVAAADPRLAAAVAQTPNADGLPASRNAARFQRPGALLRFTGRALLDGLGSLVGRPPRLVPLVGQPGTVAMLTTPDALRGDEALHADRYPEWRQEVAARSALGVAVYRPGRYAHRVRCPLLVMVCDQDQSALAEPAARAARRAPRGELIRLPGGHYAPFLDQHEPAVAAQLTFLRHHLTIPGPRS